MILENIVKSTEMRVEAAKKGFAPEEVGNPGFIMTWRPGRFNRREDFAFEKSLKGERDILHM